MGQHNSRRFQDSLPLSDIARDLRYTERTLIRNHHRGLLRFKLVREGRGWAVDRRSFQAWLTEVFA